jgi:phytoene/squalene synthetase
MKQLFDSSSYQCSKLVTRNYSTSFSLGIRLLAPSIRPAIYAIYGFVRYADEIVDTFYDHNQEELLDEFQADYEKAVERGISMNPILNSFQEVVNRYDLHEMVEAFMTSMRMDLDKTEYQSQEEYEQYIYGSADVVGLMCLHVFVNGDKQLFEQLKAPAMLLGTVFQKVNFLRDIKDDFEERGRSYFPNVANYELTDEVKAEIIEDIEEEFGEAFKGIMQLPVESRFGVYLAYRYYLRLLKKLKARNSEQILNSRTRVSNPGKAVILFKSYVRFKLNII